MRISDWSSDVCSSDLELSDLRWIREEFLDDLRDHGRMIVHGHSITNEPDEQANRIGIDIGAFRSGTLPDRKRVVYGKSVSVREDLGGRRHHKKKNKNKKTKTQIMLN